MKLHKIKRGLRFALVFIFFIIVVSGISVFRAITLDTIRIKGNDLKEAFSSKDLQSTYVNEDEESIQISSMDDIDKAIAFVPGFCVPTYVPGGYLLQKLEINKLDSNSYNAQYRFSKDETDYFFINLHKYDEQGSQNLYDVEMERIDLKDRALLKWVSTVDDTYGVTVFDAIRMINVKGTIPHEEMLLIAEGLKLY